jgi:DNA-directed RNA polymerase subunit RPC12/RpoP
MYEEIITSYNKTLSFAQTGRLFNISRQRVHQIICQYRNYGKGNRNKLYKIAWEDKCKICKKNKSSVLHHKDFNNKNDTANNLLPVCNNCHAEVHNIKRRKDAQQQICIICNKPFISLNQRLKKNTCLECSQKQYYILNKDNILEYNKSYINSHREYYALKNKEWLKNNKERRAKYMKKYILKKKLQNEMPIDSL